MGSTERTVNFHFFKSIKGGSGKSAIAFFEVIDKAICEYEEASKKKKAAPDEDKPKKEKIPRCCLVDADFRGSSLANLYLDYPSVTMLDVGRNPEPHYGLSVKGTKVSGSREIPELVRLNEDEFIYYTDCMINNDEIHLDSCRYTVQYRKDEAEAPNVGATVFEYDLYLCNPDSATKKAFTAYSSEFAAKSITIPFFKSYFKNFLLKLSTNYDDIFIDMSPGEDDLTNAIIQIVLDIDFAADVKKFYKNHHGKNLKSVNCHFTLISTTEASHVTALKDAIVSFITERKHREKTVGKNGDDTVDVRGVINHVAPYWKVTTDEVTGEKLSEILCLNPEFSDPTQANDFLNKHIQDVNKRISSQQQGYSLCVHKYYPEYDMRSNDGSQLTNMAKARAYRRAAKLE